MCQCKLGFQIDLSSCILTLFDGRFMIDFSVGRFRRKYRSVVFVLKSSKLKADNLQKMVEITTKSIEKALSFLNKIESQI